VQSIQNQAGERNIPPFRARESLNPHHTWTTKRTAEWLSLFIQGLAHSQIARKCDITRNASIGKAGRLEVFVDGRWTVLKNAFPRATDNPRNRRERIELRRSASDKPRAPRNKLSEPRRIACERAVNRIAARLNQPRSQISIPELEPAPDGLIRLLDLTPSMCHWPMGDPMEDGFHFCSRRKSFGVPYCEHHAALACKRG